MEVNQTMTLQEKVKAENTFCWIEIFFVFGNDDNDEDEPLIYLSSLFGSSRSQKLHLSNSPEHKNTLNWRFAVSLKDLKTCKMNFRKFQIWVELLWEAYVTTIKEEL